MRVIKNQNGFEIRARDANLFKRFVVYNLLIHICAMILCVLLLAYLVIGNITNPNIYIVIIVMTISIFIGNIIRIELDNYYLVSLIVEQNNLQTVFYLMNKKVLLNKKIDDLDFKLTTFGSGMYSVSKKVVIFEGKNRIFEILPHNSVIYREYKDDDIEEIYNLLIEHQNKSIQQETTE